VGEDAVFEGGDGPGSLRSTPTWLKVVPQQHDRRRTAEVDPEEAVDRALLNLRTCLPARDRRLTDPQEVRELLLREGQRFATLANLLREGQRCLSGILLALVSSTQSSLTGRTLEQHGERTIQVAFQRVQLVFDVLPLP
jgi:hypothetical protein